MQDSVLERWLAFLQTGLSPVEPSVLILAHSYCASFNIQQEVPGAVFTRKLKN